MHTHTQQWVLSSGSIHNSTQHTAISDMCVYMFLLARLYVCCGLLCVCAVCSVNVWSVAQSSVWLRPVERALCSLCIYSVICVECAFLPFSVLAFWLL